MTILAYLLRDHGRSADAVAYLRLIYDRFTDGFDTADLIAAANGFWIRLGAGARLTDRISQRLNAERSVQKRGQSSQLEDVVRHSEQR